MGSGYLISSTISTNAHHSDGIMPNLTFEHMHAGVHARMPESQSREPVSRIPFDAVSTLGPFRSFHDAPVDSALGPMSVWLYSTGNVSELSSHINCSIAHSFPWKPS